MKVALVYDRVNKWGGAERVLLALHELFPKAPLYTSVYNPQTAPWAKVFTVKPSFLQRIPFASKNHEFLAPLMPLAFESFSFDEYDLVISVTSESAKGIITRGKTKHICYCLTPTRYLWSGYETYFANPFLRILTKPLVAYLRKWDLRAATQPDVMVAISKEVQKRIKKYYYRDAAVVYPPMTLGEKSQKSKEKNKTGDYFLVVSRLSKFTQYKRVDLAIAACKALKLPLKIAGSGNWREELEAKAGDTISFLGSLTDDELIRYYKGCKALIFPGIEDFGLTIVEAQRFGKPVIAYRGGGAMETIIEGKTGYFFEKQTRPSLMEALKKFEAKDFSARDCMRQAEKFNTENFKKNFLSLVNKAI